MFALFSWERLRFIWERFWQGFGNPLDLQAFLSIIRFHFFFTLTLLLLSRKWDELQALTRQGATGQIRGGLANTPESPNPQKKRKAMAEELLRVADLITANIIGTQKEVLTSDEAARYMGVSKSCLYKLTMNRQVPHYKPNGKCCYFNRFELEAWLQTNRVSTDDELARQAQKIAKKGGLR